MRGADKIFLPLLIALFLGLPIAYSKEPTKWRAEPGAKTPYRYESESLSAVGSRVAPETLKSLIRSILSQKAFQEKESGENIWHRIGTKLSKLWKKIEKLSIEGAGIPDWALILVGVCLALMVGYLVFIVIRAYTGELKARQTPTKGARYTPESLFTAGEEQARKGNFAEALRLYYKSVLLLLFPTVGLTTTSSTLARILDAKNPALSANFANLSESFNRVYYGGGELSEKALSYLKEQALHIFRTIEGRDSG